MNDESVKIYMWCITISTQNIVSLAGNVWLSYMIFEILNCHLINKKKKNVICIIPFRAGSMQSTSQADGQLRVAGPLVCANASGSVSADIRTPTRGP